MAVSLQSKAISALKWATAAKLVVQLASWAGTLVVVRLLTPEDYGLMAKVAVVCSIAGAIAELGLGAAIVRSVDIARDDVRKIFGVSLIFSVGITIALGIAAPLLSSLFQDARLTWPVAVASLQIIVSAAAIVPTSLATRDLSFRRLSQIEMIAGVASIGVTLLLAYIGAGVWALVLGTLFGTFVRSASLLMFGERVWPLFSLRGVSEYIKFGLTLVGSRVSYFILVQADVLIGSAFLSTTEIGHYAVALQLATLPMSKVMGIINQIALPVVAQQQQDLERVRQSTLRSVGIISLAAFPALWGISAVAPELVRVLFGSGWLPAIPALALLPLVVPIRMLSSVLFTTSLALGFRQLDMRNTVANFVLLPTGFFIGAHWGLVGLCCSWLVSVPLSYLVSVPPVLRAIGIRPIELLSECGPPAAGAIVMYGAVAALRPLVEPLPAFAGLALLSAMGACVYFAVIAFVSRRHISGARAFLGALMTRRATGSD